MEILRTTASRAPLLAATLVAALLSAGCGRSQPPGRDAAQAPAATASGAPRMELGAGVQLDSGNSSYRAKDYAGALAHYRNAAGRDPSLVAAWFGIYMAQTAMGNTVGADSAMQKVQALAPGTMSAHPATGATGATGASGSAGGTGAGAGALPPGHPVLPARPDR